MPNQDTPRIAKRRARKKRTISQMIALYCAGNHAEELRTERGHCGEPLCADCASLDAYAVLRTERCRKMHIRNVSCDTCENHCYKPGMREDVRAVMRYSGPRMMRTHPIAAIRHLLGV